MEESPKLVIPCPMGYPPTDEGILDVIQHYNPQLRPKKETAPSASLRPSTIVLVVILFALLWFIGTWVIKGLQDPNAGESIKIVQNYSVAGGRSIDSLLENSGGMQSTGVIWRSEKVQGFVYAVSARIGNEVYYFEASIPERRVRPLSENSQQLMGW